MKNILVLLVLVSSFVFATGPKTYPYPSGAVWNQYTNIVPDSVYNSDLLILGHRTIPYALSITSLSTILSRSGTSSFWNLLGNSGTSISTNFIGTIDNVSLLFKTNDTSRIIIDNTGRVGIGTVLPAYKFHVVGKTNISYIGSNGINYQLTMGDTIPGLPYKIPHLGLFAGPSDGLHSLIESEDNAAFGTHQPFHTVMGVVDNAGQTHFTVSCDTTVDIHTQDTLNTFNLHYHFGAAGLSLFSGGTYSNTTGLRLDANQTALDIVGGFVPAFLDSVQLIAVASPAIGQIYYCIDCSSNANTKGLNAQWTGSLWRKW